MTSRTSESSYWDSHTLPHSQYHPQSQHYYSSVPSSMASQQQPRQSSTFHSASSENSPTTYSAPPSSNTYYGSFYQSQMNSNSVNGQGHHGNSATPNYTSLSNNHNQGYTSHSNGNSNSHSNGSVHSAGPSSSFGPSPHGVTVQSSHNMSPYPMMNHSGYHLSNNGIYQRSHGGNGGGSGHSDFAGPMTHASSDLPPHSQHTFHNSSQHSASPTIDGSEYGHGLKQKRRQVKNACVNCQKACKRCDEGRACTRCIKYGLTDTCQDSARKERKRGIKRGPYKRRATTGSQSISSSGNSYPIPPPPSSSFMVMDSLSSSPFMGSHHGNAHGSLVSPHQRGHRDQQQQQNGNGNGIIAEAGQGMDSSLLNTPGYPTSAHGTAQRSMAPLITNENVAAYNTRGSEHYHAMQPPRFTSRHDYDRNSNSPAQSMYSVVNRSNALPPPVSAPASSTSFHSSPASGYSSRSLFSPPALMSTNANFLSANSHNRLHSDSSINTMTTSSTTANSSLSPRTPMGSSNMMGDMGMLGNGPQTLSANSTTSSSPGGGRNGHGHVHHPGTTNTTTTTSLPSTATGAFLNSSNALMNNAQPFPLHIPHSARWRSSNNGAVSSSINGDRDVMIRNRGDELVKEEQLAPIKLHNSNDSDLSSGTLSIRYQLPSPRMTTAESPRSDHRSSNLPKMDVVA